MKDCVFCQIASGKLDSHKIYEDDDMLAFLDIKPVNFGHVLIIPKAHYPLMVDAPDELVGRIFIKAKELMPAVKSATDAFFVKLAVLGQDVAHFHVHLMPVYEMDTFFYWPKKHYPEGEMEKMAEKIRLRLPR